MADKFKWKVEDYFHNKDTGITKYKLVSFTSVVNCESSRPESDVKKDIKKALERMNKRISMKC